MPLAASSRCPRCHRLGPNPGLCVACKRHGPRGQARRIYNSKAWRVLRDQVLSEEPWCRVCHAVGFLEVDHRIPVEVAPWLALERSNLQALCPPCHAAKTRREG